MVVPLSVFVNMNLSISRTLLNRTHRHLHSEGYSSSVPQGLISLKAV